MQNETNELRVIQQRLEWKTTRKMSGRKLSKMAEPVFYRTPEQKTTHSYLQKQDTGKISTDRGKTFCLLCLPCLFLFVLLFSQSSQVFSHFFWLRLWKRICTSLALLLFTFSSLAQSVLWFISRHSYCLVSISSDSSIRKRTSIPTALSGAIPSAPWWDSGLRRTVVCWPPIAHTPAAPARTSPASLCWWPIWKSRYALIYSRKDRDGRHQRGRDSSRD